jgi:uncharacterized protein (DUF1501 family)
MNRRRFISAAAGAALSAGPMRLWAVPDTAAKTKLVVVLLRGGYDAASLLVPYQSAFYYESRPNIAIARPVSGNPETALPLDSYWALHPALKDSIYPLYQGRQVVFIPYAGSQDETRSHFHAQDVIELGQAYGGRLNYGSGFLNRWVEVLGGASGVSFTANLPLVFKGNARITNVALKGDGKNPFNERDARLLEQMYQGTALSNDVREGLQTRRQVSDDLQHEMVESARGAVSAKDFEQEARRMARMMREHASYAIGFVDVGGWDTHVHQGAARGALSDRLRGLGAGLAGFAQEIGPAWRDTIVVVLSEFGRTFRENGDRGTDHGHGSVIWILGGGIAGGVIAGEQIGVQAGNLFQNRDYPVLNEYRALLSFVLTRAYTPSAADLQYVFPGVKGARYPFL